MLIFMCLFFILMFVMLPSTSYRGIRIFLLYFMIALVADFFCIFQFFTGLWVRCYLPLEYVALLALAEKFSQLAY